MRKPWNLPDLPVHSLLTFGAENIINMNICTYVTAVSMAPKQYAIAVYEGTKTLQNLETNNLAVLQYLHPDQIKLVRHLGQKSGMSFDKNAWLRKGDRLTTWRGYEVLAGASAWVELHQIDRISAGDHELFMFDVIASKTLREEVLTTTMLREGGFIR
jgi:flavin reductase (DIM6/NTAB) family NADH-FMN oxidoreductase RutF